MARLTAIEFGADTCAIARVAERRGQVEVLDVEMIDPAAFPGGESFTVVLRQARRARRARARALAARGRRNMLARHQSRRRGDRRRATRQAAVCALVFVGLES